MADNRSKGEGGLHWDMTRKRWIATVTVGYDARGKRVVRKKHFRTRTEATVGLRQLVRELESGELNSASDVTVADIVNDWLEHGLTRQVDATTDQLASLAKRHVIPRLGKRKLKELKASEVDAWLRSLSTTLSTDSLRRLHSCLNRSIRRAMARDLVSRNVAAMVDIPRGQLGRPSRSLTPEQVDAILTRTTADPIHAYIVLAVMTGARTEELRPLLWNNVHLGTQTINGLAGPPHLEVWRSVRSGGDTKTRRSRRTLVLPNLCVQALKEHRLVQEGIRRSAGPRWEEHGLVFTTAVGTVMDAGNVRRQFVALYPLWTTSIRMFGLRVSSATRSSRSCPAQACPSKRSHAWSDTTAPQ